MDMTETKEQLERMFEADRSMPGWYKAFPMYAVHAQVGAKTWWEPLSTVWRHQGINPDPNDGTARWLSWPDAWALLQRLHSEYQASRGQ